MFADLLGYRLPDQGWVPWVSPILGTILYGYGGAPFLTGAVSEIRSRRPGMMLLVASTTIFGASNFPPSGGRNPTETVMALAWRTADHLVDEWEAITG